MPSKNTNPKTNRRLEKWGALIGGWSSAQPPRKPSDQDLRYYKRQLVERRPAVVALLGCTPSLRTLAGEMKSVKELLVLDFLNEAFDASTTIAPKYAKEHFIQIDWLDCSNVLFDVDMVIGDQVIDNIPNDRLFDFFRQVYFSLSSGGSFVSRFALAINELEAETVASLASKWLGELEMEGEQNAFDGLWDDLLTISASRSYEKKGLSIGLLSEELNKTIEGFRTIGSTQHVKFLEKFIEMYQVTFEYEWSNNDWEDILMYSAAWFKIGCLHNSDDYSAAFHQPIVRFDKL